MEISEQQRAFNRLVPELSILQNDIKGLWGDKKFSKQAEIDSKLFEIDLALDEYNAEQKALARRLTSKQT